jgi:hypothetical protein
LLPITVLVVGPPSPTFRPTTWTYVIPQVCNHPTLICVNFHSSLFFSHFHAFLLSPPGNSVEAHEGYRWTQALLDTCRSAYVTQSWCDHSSVSSHQSPFTQDTTSPSYPPIGDYQSIPCLNGSSYHINAYSSSGRFDSFLASPRRLRDQYDHHKNIGGQRGSRGGNMVGALNVNHPPHYPRHLRRICRSYPASQLPQDAVTSCAVQRREVGVVLMYIVELTRFLD